MKPTTTYIYHVTGTLTWDHIVNSLESLRRQNFHWKKFVLFNHSEWPSENIMDIFLSPGCISKFDQYESLAIPDLPPTCVADWNWQMQNIGGTDRYLSHKADFYLADHVCEYIDHLESDEWFILFNKIDMKEKATIFDYREFASKSWQTNISREDVGRYPRPHLGKIAVPCMNLVEKPDGTMHAYTDQIRSLYAPDFNEINRRWGLNTSFAALREKAPFIIDEKFYALHMWHHVPEKADPEKTFPGERF